jgi:hypothetical protein
MLRLRPEQYEALQSHSLCAMESRIADALRAAWPALCRSLGDGPLVARIGVIRRLAAGRGIERETDVLRLARVALAWGEEFHAPRLVGWAAEILNWKNTDASTRLDALEGRSEAELQRRPDLQGRLR